MLNMVEVVWLSLVGSLLLLLFLANFPNNIITTNNHTNNSNNKSKANNNTKASRNSELFYFLNYIQDRYFLAGKIFLQVWRGKLVCELCCLTFSLMGVLFYNIKKKS